MKNKTGKIIFTDRIQFGKQSYQAVKISDSEYEIFEDGYPLGKITNKGFCWLKETMWQRQSKPNNAVTITPLT